MSALSLYKKHTQAELVHLDAALTADPLARDNSNSIFIYTPKARKRLAEIAQAITWHMEDARAAAGDPVKVAGYSGRKSK